MITARLLVLNLLVKMSENAYSNVILDKALVESDLTLQDKKFASNLFYGVIERQITLDYVISKYSSKPIEKLNNEILQILRIGLYQLIFTPSVPDNAAVNESVILVKQIKKTSASGFVNAILRNFIRDKKNIDYPKDRIKSLSIEYSCPEWLIRKWIKEYGEDSIVPLLANTVKKPSITVRVNTITTNMEELINKFNKDEIEVTKSEQINNCIEIKSCGSIEQNDTFKQGLFHVQDLSSQLCCLALSPKKGEIVLDLCAAPGGKTFTLAEIMDNSGQIFAFDIHQKRVDMIKSGADRLKITIIKALIGNAKVFDAEIPFADKILCDVPCAGLGVISKKPEIKYKNPDELKDLPKIQYEIIENAVKYLKVGGELVYSTCSLSKEENDEVIDKFLSLNNNFKGINFLTEFGTPFGDYKATILPEHFNSDGFFISKIVKLF